MRTFQFSDAKSHKFWAIDVRGSVFTVTYGKVGAPGQSTAKTFPSPEKAQAEADKLVREKVGKGYIETTPPAVVSEGDALEMAIRANPDDPLPCHAYADYLIERGDPRGEFMRTQIALEDPSQPKGERDELRRQEKALLKEHRAEWVGAWADLPDVNGPCDDWTPPGGWVPYRFTRGLLTGLEVGRLTVTLARMILEAPQLRFVRDLTVHEVEWVEGGDDNDNEDEDCDASEFPALNVLMRWPQLRHVRSFRFGGGEPIEEYGPWGTPSCHVPGDAVSGFVKQMPDLETLHVMAHFGSDMDKVLSLPLTRLRELLLYHGHHYPLDRLARNPSLTNLRELYCHPHALEPGDDPYIRLPEVRAVCGSNVLRGLTHLRLRLADFGDDGVAEVVKSGILKRLKVLDLRHGMVTDAGATALAASPDVKHLDALDLSRNRIGPSGVAALRATGVKAQLDHQLDPDAEDWHTFGEGDIE